MLGTIFRTSDPCDAGSRSDAFTFAMITGDLELLWDDYGQLYIFSQGAVLLTLNFETGEIMSKVNLWPGTGEVWPRALPHLY